MSDDHVLVTQPTKQVWERVNCQINQPPYEDIQEHDEHGSFRVAFQDRHGDGYYQSENDTVVVPTRDLSTGLIRKLVYHELIHRGQSLHFPFCSMNTSKSAATSESRGIITGTGVSRWRTQEQTFGSHFKYCKRNNGRCVV